MAAARDPCLDLIVALLEARPVSQEEKKLSSVVIGMDYQ